MAEETIAKKTVKDSVFCDLFKRPKYLLQLYRALHPEDTEVTESMIGGVTIKNVFLDQLYNDLGFMVGSRLLLLIEAQSSWSVNIIPRLLMYLANTWKEYIEEHKLNVYGSKKIELPMTELYVIYTGDRKDQPEWISLADEFFGGRADFVNVKVKVIYDGEKGDIINQYVTFSKVYTEQLKIHGRTRATVLETIRICKDNDVLGEYLSGREKEVISIMLELFEQEYAVERYGDEREEKGEMNGKKEMALSLSKMGLSVDKIAEAAKVSLETVQKWLSGNVSVTGK